MPDPNAMAVVVDTSGSMREHGKAMLARNLIAHVRECRRLSDGSWYLGNLVVVLWGPEASVVELLPEQEVPAFPVGGRAQMQPLLAVLEPLLPGDGLLRVLLLSDGHLASSELAAFKAWQRRNPKVSVRTLFIGPDAASATLKKMADSGGVFPPEEVVSALSSWALPREPALPTCVADVVDRAVRSEP